MLPIQQSMTSVPGRCPVAVIAVGAYMIIRCVGEFLYGLAEFLFCLKYILVRTLILQCIKVTFHWSIIVRISGFAHALDHMGGLTESVKVREVYWLP